MSLADLRPRRIIAGPPLPMPAHPALDAALAMQQQRFQRVLQAVPTPPRMRHEPRQERTFVEWPLRPQPMPPNVDTARPQVRYERQPETTPDRAAAPRDTGLAATRLTTPPPASPPATTPQRARRTPTARPIAHRPAVEVPELPPRRDLLADPQAWKHAGLAKPAPEDWDVDLAHRITALCQRGGPSIQSWSLTVPLDAAVLPETELHMALSPLRLGLRFQTQSPYSMALVRRHEDRLVALLKGALPASREIDLELS